MASVAFSYRDNFFFCLDQVTCLFQVSYPCLTAFVSVHAFVLACRCSHLSFEVDASRCWKAVSLTYFEVVRVVSRCDLYSTCSLFRIRICVCDNRDLLVEHWDQYVLAHQILVSFIFRMYCDSHVSKDGFRS